jgi:hypothetical protein
MPNDCGAKPSTSTLQGKRRTIIAAIMAIPGDQL